MNARSDNQHRVVAAIIWRDGKVLVGQRPAHKRHGGLWEFPGGKIEPGETDLDATRRELFEELGVEVQEVGEVLFRHQDAASGYLIEFVAATITGRITPSEHQQIEFRDPDQLGQISLAPSDERFVASGILLASRPKPGVSVADAQ